MDRKEVIQILESLADGIDPTTGEIFPSDSPYQNVEITRALFHALEQVKKAKPPKAKKPLPLNQGEKWSPEADQELKSLYLEGHKIADLAEKYQRSNGAITSRLAKLGFLT